MNENAQSNGVQEKVQVFGRFLSGMVMPNIGAFIAWGILTALFIPTGWLPNAYLAKASGPMVQWLIPLLIGFTGGRAIYDHRGGVVGAIATAGVIAGADIPMFLGAMIVGPLGGYCIKKFDDAFQEKIPAGFEMLVNNFSAGILGAILAVLAYVVIGPIVLALNTVLKNAVEVLVSINLIPLVSIIVEPAKILFLNNAINHGIFTPIGIQESQNFGKSLFFLIEANPGPGFGMLLAYCLFGKGAAKGSAPGAVIIHFLGGIHEIYFPYILMRPKLLLAVIPAGMCGVFTLNVLNGGLIAPASPGSIFAVLAMTPKGAYFANILAVVIATAVSFAISSVILKASKDDDTSLETAQADMKAMKSRAKGTAQSTAIKGSEIRKIIYACDAGMGSSAMGASALRNKFKKAGFANVSVTNCAIENIPADAQIVVSHEKLAERAEKASPQAEHIFVTDFLQNNVFDILSERIKNDSASAISTEEIVDDTPAVFDSNLLKLSNIKIGLDSIAKEDAIKMAGQILVDGSYVNSGYIDAMLRREEQVSTYIGKGVAIPHGDNDAKGEIKASGLSVLQFPNGINFGDETAYILIGIAGIGNEHLTILSNIATMLDENENAVNILKNAKSAQEIYDLFTK
ncbi:PTS mannitol transporter subunit IICBA [Pectinatus brassicae]|uniref:Mannitol-specific phosphotransferase enzyme IIA component n=1 Tax=Pectinatus brassicae TaxID=862415 RepID=A0A840UF45_9FIRM|nr:PTS mannitol transporter subunit IICBA [Pectinatus brassicae]MBB5335726.1 PTS system mannitol-specific IIC component [Pectinatus brassicae]